MRNLIIMLIYASEVVSCSSDLNCKPETINTDLTSNKTILVNYNSEFQRNDYSISSGEGLLFEYSHSGAQCDDVYDDEWGERLIFIIDSETRDFELRDENIMAINCFYQQYGAWVRHNQLQIKDGIIKGEKISENEWEISVSVTTTPLFPDEAPKLIEFVEIFRE